MSVLEKQNRNEILYKKFSIFEDVNNLKIKNYPILSIIKENNNKNSTKTAISSSYINLKEYKINKFDELNKSFSNISHFDLEKEEDDSNNLSFNSLEHDDEFETLDILISKKINKNNKEKNKEYELELDKEFEKLKNEILNEKTKNKNNSKD